MKKIKILVFCTKKGNKEMTEQEIQESVNCIDWQPTPSFYYKPKHNCYDCDCHYERHIPNNTKG